jgi:glycosyltransferase involved in cell wall biosynthesis
MVTIYTVAYNESIMLPHFIKHYRTNFPECRIVVYDNMSTDDTVKIALENNCEVIPYDTGGKLSDLRYQEIKNNCWKNATTDWVLICDIDEVCDINCSDLQAEDTFGATIISFEGWNMINLKKNLDFNSITHGIRSTSYDKRYCFNKNFIREINYNMGCHAAEPQGVVIESEFTYRCRHYKYFNADYMVKRHALFASRLSEENIKIDAGTHYLYSEEQIRKEFSEARKQAIKIL